ncbi:MAG: hypothetical protein HZB51_14930 [Chloroflexi bacterium]|nr:hypothetical protein [Chloroflexota bacterium]
MFPVRLTALRTAFSIFILSFAIYSIPPVYDLLHKPFFTWANGQDVVSASILPIPILEHGDFYLEEYKPFFTANWHSPYFVAEVNNHLVSRYPVSAAIIATPFYGIPLGTGWLRHPGYDWLTFAWSAFFPAKFASAFFTALTVVMIFFCAYELADLKTGIAIAAVFGFGTSVWSTASQALWQQTPSILFQSIGIWFLLRGRRKGAMAVAPAAFFFSAATVSRANDGFTALLFTIYVLIQHRAAIWRWMAFAILPAAFTLVYNSVYNGSPWVFGYQEGFLSGMSLPRIDGLFGLLISPSRGLFVYSPFLILAPYGLWLAYRNKDRLFYSFSAAAFSVCYIILSTFEAWDGGWGFGTRLLVDVMPYITLLLIPVVQQLSGWNQMVFGITVGYSAILQSFGLWDYGVRWHWHWDNWTHNNWDILENEPLFYLKQYLEMAGHYLGRFIR